VIHLCINGTEYDVPAQPHESLADVLHDRLHLVGTRVSCAEGECGCCTVLVDGEPATGCLIVAAQAEGRDVRTIEGLGSPGNLHPIQQAFVDEHGFQCGFCTSGFVMSATALLECNPDPTREETEEALSGNLCRCGAYPFIVASVMTAAARMRETR
jgi:aerobic carbon-monoxide dehydrogenase small subunit